MSRATCRSRRHGRELSPAGCGCTRPTACCRNKAVDKAKVAQLEVAGGWKTVLVPLSKFVNEKGATPANWSKVDRIQISGVATQTEPPRFSHFRWVMP